MASKPEWRRIAVSELQAALDSKQEFQMHVPSTAGVYMWKQSFSPAGNCYNDPGAMLDFCDRLISTVYGEVSGATVTHFLRIGSIQVAGSGLTVTKRSELARFLNSPAKLKWFGAFLESMETSSPALYVGESKRLDARIYQHMTGKTDFSARLESHETLGWGDLALHLMDFGSEAVGQGLLTSLEFVATVASISGMTSRPG